jgi:uncharacterized membrane protein YkoI
MHVTSRTLAVLLAAICAFAVPAFAADTPAPAATKAQTKVSEADARKTALAGVPSGTVQSSKLMTDKGRQVWSIDLKSASSTNVFTVQVDADSGRIVAKSVKSAAAAAKAKKS